MGWDGAGGYTRQHNFSADASAGIKILALRVDQELDDIASAIPIALAKNGQNVPTANLPMGGFRHVNVGAPTSVNNYMRSREFIENVPIFMTDVESSADRISISAQYFTSVSANQAPGDGTRILVRVGSNKSSAVVYLNGHSANVEFQDGNRANTAMVSGGIYEMLFSSVDVAWKITAPDSGRTAAEIAAGVTPTSYQYEPGDVRRYGPALDGSTDDTAALARWVSVGGRLKFPVAATAKITSALVLASNTTIEAIEGATIRQYTANESVLTATSKNDISVEGLTLYAVGSFSSTYNGNGVNFSQCSRVAVRHCTVKNHRGYGILFDRCTYGDVVGNRLISADVSGAVDHTDVAGDVALLGSSYCHVIGNKCVSGNGIGVNVQTVQDGDTCIRNVVQANIIEDCLIYGINLYRGGSGTTHTGTVVVGNIIKNVTGAIPEATDGLVFGNGIYGVQASEFVIAGNHIRETHSAGVVVVDTLAAGAIGTTGCGQHVIKGNVIRDAGYNGITVRNPTAGAVGNEMCIVEGNALTEVARFGIEVQDKSNITVANNKLDNITNRGIYVYAPTTSTKQTGIIVQGNSVNDCDSIGISVHYGTSPVVSSNQTNTTGNDGIHVQNSDDAVIADNNVNAPGSGAYGIGNYTTNARSVITGNNVRGTGTAPAYAYYFGSYWKRNTTNLGSNYATAFALGDYLAEDTAIPAAGTNVQGDIVYASNVAAAGTIGWVCTTGGSPGTWKTWGAVSA